MASLSTGVCFYELQSDYLEQLILSVQMGLKKVKFGMFRGDVPGGKVAHLFTGHRVEDPDRTSVFVHVPFRDYYLCIGSQAKLNRTMQKQALKLLNKDNVMYNMNTCYRYPTHNNESFSRHAIIYDLFSLKCSV